jgi:hypothetical protein
MTKNQLKILIENAPQKVTFVKKNGETRVMHCAYTDLRARESNDLLTVWDIVADGWRRVNIPTIMSVEPSELFSE